MRKQNGQRPATHFQFTQIFQEFDHNGDGLLSHKEVSMFARRFLRSQEDDDAEIMSIVERIWVNFDSDRNNKLSRYETLKFLNAFFKD